MTASTGLHESKEDLPAEAIDRHRAIVSLMEELEAVDWYDQRVHACTDPELREILAHNRDEEKEHAAMTLEWLRRNDPRLDEELRSYLFQDAPIVGHEEDVTSDGGSDESAESTAARGGDGSLGIGSLRAAGTE